jgi:hypothetical protein
VCCAFCAWWFILFWHLHHICCCTYRRTKNVKWRNLFLYTEMSNPCVSYNFYIPVFCANYIFLEKDTQFCKQS